MDNVQNVTENTAKKGMKKSTKIVLMVLSIIFSLAAVITPVIVFTLPKDPGYTEVETEEFLLRYRPGENYYDIVQYKGDGEEIDTDGDGEPDSIGVKIPADIDGVPVRNVLDGAFSYNSNIQAVIIETKVDDETGDVIGIESLGDRVFECCENLTSITIPETVTSLGTDAFA